MVRRLRIKGRLESAQHRPTIVYAHTEGRVFNIMVYIRLCEGMDLKIHAAAHTTNVDKARLWPSKFYILVTG